MRMGRYRQKHYMSLRRWDKLRAENEKVKGSIMKVAELENTGKLVAAGY